MKKVILFLFFALTSCQALPQLYQAVEDIADDTAIKVQVSREAIQKQKDITLSLDVKNKDAVTN